LDLWGLFGEVVLLWLFFAGSGAGVEGARGDVESEELLIHQVDDGGDKLLKVFGSVLEVFDILY